MTIAIIGGTNLSTTLGNKYISRGMKVVFGVREGFSSKQIEWKILKMQNQYVLGFCQAIEKSDVVLVCCENEILPDVCESLVKSHSRDKLIIDCTNGQYKPELGCNTRYIQKVTGHSRITKAFNNLGLDYPKSDPLELIKETYFCGDDIKDKILVKKLIELIGFKAIDAGKLENACLLEAVYHLRREISTIKSGDSNCHFKLMSV